MQSTSVPAKFPIPFASSAGGLYTRTIPQASQIGIQDGAASLTDGFPPKCFVPVASGGTPPFGKDFNGLLKQVTQWNQWQQAGGPIVYDSAFQSSIGGYPAGAIVQPSAGGPLFMSLADNNMTAPAMGAASWMPLPTFGGNVTSVTGTATLTTADAGLVIVNASSGNINLTMPSVVGADNVPLPFYFVRADSSSNSVTLTAASGNTFWPSGASTFSLATLTSYEFIGNSSAAWYLMGGTYFAALNGSSSQVFNVAPAVTSTEATQLAQTIAGGSLQDVTSSRSFNTVYTNSTSRPIVVYAITTNNGSVAWGLTGYISGSACSASYMPANASAAISITLVVNPGETYSINQSTNTPTLAGWREIR